MSEGKVQMIDRRLESEPLGFAGSGPQLFWLTSESLAPSLDIGYLTPDTYEKETCRTRIFNAR